jgi:hypothetical protein
VEERRPVLADEEAAHASLEYQMSSARLLSPFRAWLGMRCGSLLCLVFAARTWSRSRSRARSTRPTSPTSVSSTEKTTPEAAVAAVVTPGPEAAAAAVEVTTVRTPSGPDFQ